MQRPDDNEIDLLLAAGRLTDAQRDQAFQRVMQTVSAETRSPLSKPSFFRRLRWALLGSASLAVLALMFMQPQPSGLRAKGSGGGASLPFLSVECEAASLSGCPIGSRLLFRSALQAGLVAAYAEPADGQERIWYFAPEEPVSLAQNSHETGYMRSSVIVGAEHRPGLYRVHLVQLSSSVARSALLARDENVIASRTVDLVIK